MPSLLSSPKRIKSLEVKEPEAQVREGSREACTVVLDAQTAGKGKSLAGGVRVSDLVDDPYVSIEPVATHVERSLVVELRRIGGWSQPLGIDF